MILGTEDGMPVGKSAEAVGIEAEGSARMLEPMGWAVKVSVPVGTATLDPLWRIKSVLGSSFKGVMVEGAEAAIEGGNMLAVLPGFIEPTSLGTLEGRPLTSALLGRAPTASVSDAAPLINSVAPVDFTKFAWAPGVVDPPEVSEDCAVAWTGVAPPILAVASEPSTGFDVSTEDAAETAPDGKYSLDVSTADVTETA